MNITRALVHLKAKNNASVFFGGTSKLRQTIFPVFKIKI